MTVGIALKRRTADGANRRAPIDSSGLGSRGNAEHEQSREGKLGLGNHGQFLAVIVVAFKQN